MQPTARTLEKPSHEHVGEWSNPGYPPPMFYIYSTPRGDRRCISREELPWLVLDFVQAFEDQEEERAWAPTGKKAESLAPRD